MFLNMGGTFGVLWGRSNKQPNVEGPRGTPVFLIPFLSPCLSLASSYHTLGGVGKIVESTSADPEVR